MEATAQNKRRIKSELHAAGVSRLKQLRFPSRFLIRVIHKDEHIEAVLQGRSKDAPSLMGYTEAMLVATDRRILFIEHRPIYTTLDEISYDVVSGVSVSSAGLFGSLTLFTKIADFTLSFVSFTLAQRFADFIEGRAIDRPQPPTA
ncbi:MAG TPA: PH domain-containing protein [Candidatus Saccharimonadales bacterium]